MKVRVMISFHVESNDRLNTAKFHSFSRTINMPYVPHIGERIKIKLGSNLDMSFSVIGVEWNEVNKVANVDTENIFEEEKFALALVNSPFVTNHGASTEPFPKGFQDLP